MQKVLPLIFPETVNRFGNYTHAQLSEIEQECVVKLALEVLKYRHKPGKMLTKPDDSRDYLQLKLGDRKNEVFGAVFLDNKHRILCDQEMFHGSISSASVYPRVVVQQALECNAAALFLYHNHPSGDSEPSMADKHITKRLNDALALIDVRVLDHLVVGSLGSVSFAERGLI